MQDTEIGGLPSTMSLARAKKEKANPTVSNAVGIFDAECAFEQDNGFQTWFINGGSIFSGIQPP